LGILWGVGGRPPTAQPEAMPAVRVVGSASRVVEAPGFSIDELVGNVATGQDTISVARVSAKAGTSEPWLTVHYTEWLCVTSGTMVITPGTADGSAGAPVEVKAGQTVEIAPGTRFQPSFPADTEYIPVCLPAFRPDRCVREDTDATGEAIAKKLKKLHCVPPAGGGGAEAAPEVLYHMCPARDWEAAKQAGGAYYPPTFAEDDHLTHATGVPSRLVATANHYYQDSEGAWICLEFTRTALRLAGIYVRDEQATPVGDKPTDDALMADWICPHVIGGLPVSVVQKVYDMTRDGPKFLGISGLC